MKRIIFRGKFGDLVIPRSKISPENSKVVQNSIEDLKYVTIVNYSGHIIKHLQENNDYVFYFTNDSIAMVAYANALYFLKFPASC